MTQTLAIFVDAYRELNSKKLFWITLAISAFVVAVFGFVGINQNGLSVLWWDIPSPFNSKIFTAEAFYKLMFINLGINFWLGWLATILALVSTAGMIPDFLAGGSIELTLSKPIGRLRLFLTKYAAALLFVTLQVTIFSLGCFLVIGLRGGAWVPGLFIAVPLVVLFFSYLYCVCALLGMVTRSTIAALLLTMLFWFLLFGLNTTETIFSTMRLERTMQAEAGEKAVTRQRETIERIEKDMQGGAAPAAVKEPPPKPTEGGIAAMAQWATEKAGIDARNNEQPSVRLENERTTLRELESRLTSIEEGRDFAQRWHRIFFSVETALPKATETKDLLKRVLQKQADIDRMIAADDNPEPMQFGTTSFDIDQREFQRRFEASTRELSAWWIIGTSLAFEAAVLGLAAWVFCRRDF